jgi:hypothetical protein
VVFVRVVVLLRFLLACTVALLSVLPIRGTYIPISEITITNRSPPDEEKYKYLNEIVKVEVNFSAASA